MALNFPDTPTVGQSYPQPPVSGMPIYTWDGEKWTSTTPSSGGSATILTGDTPPVGAPDSALWLETDSGILFFKWNDGNSSQWVALASGASGAVLYSNPQSLTSPQKTQARVNINAASMEALANQNIFINGNMAVNQEYGLGFTGGQTTSGVRYLVDGWVGSANYPSPPTWYFGQELYGPGGPFAADCVLSISAAYPVTTTSYFCIYQSIEGNRLARLGWGTANAQPLSIGIWVQVDHGPGVMTCAIRNYAAGRSYCVPFNVNSGANYVTLTIPGCTDGSWPADNTGAAIISFATQVGSSYTAPTANAWLTGNYFGAPTQSDFHATQANALRLFGATAIPGTIPVPQELAPYAMRHYDQDLLTCQRYFRSWGGGAAYEKVGQGIGWLATMMFLTLPFAMRATPTISTSANSDWSVANASTGALVTSIGIDSVGPSSITIGFNVASGLVANTPYFLQANNNLSARFKFDARL